MTFQEHNVEPDFIFTMLQECSSSIPQDFCNVSKNTVITPQESRTGSGGGGGQLWRVGLGSWDSVWDEVLGFGFTQNICRIRFGVRAP